MAKELMTRELETNPEQFNRSRPVRDIQSDRLDPHTMATLGGLADAASTYYFMTQGRKEANPLVRRLGGTSPLKTGIAALGGLALTKLATKLIGKKSPEFAETLAAGLGAEQIGLAANNIRSKPEGSFRAYLGSLNRSVKHSHTQ